MDGFLFQSTLPARGATVCIKFSTIWDCYFNPRSPHGERHGCYIIGNWEDIFQSTLPARGATRRVGANLHIRRQFQSTLPARGATEYYSKNNGSRIISIHAPRTGSDTIHDFVPNAACISIHAPRTGSDMTPPKCCLTAVNISIHAPRTGSDFVNGVAHGQTTLISIHAPRTGSDTRRFDCMRRRCISIHAPRTGSDGCCFCRKAEPRQFQSTLPARGATILGDERSSIMKFQSTLPARGATPPFATRSGAAHRFQSTLPARGAT